MIARLRRGWPLPLLAAVVAAVVTAIVVGTADPYGDYANRSFREGANAGVVLRYALLAALAAWLAQRLAASFARRRSGEAGSRPAVLWSLALAVVAGLMIVPPLVGPSKEERRARDLRAGFVDGCARRQPRDYCTCLFNRLRKDPAADTQAEVEAVLRRAGETGVAPAPMQRAARACAGG